MYYNQTFICICHRCHQPKYQITTCTESYTQCGCLTQNDHKILFNNLFNTISGSQKADKE